MDLVSVKEKKQHSSLYVPYSYYACMIPDYIPVVPLEPAYSDPGISLS
jgi:hypothetical protein